MDFNSIVDALGRAVDFAGVVVIVAGIAWVTISHGLALVRQDRAGLFDRYRRAVGRVILLGLELLVAADIIRTVAIDPTLEGVATLGLLILIRTALSFSLEVELYGRWPWQRHRSADRAASSEG